MYSNELDDWKLGDLGFSGPVDKKATSVGNIYGNLPYIAPEALRGDGYTAKSDIYSLGFIMWELINGETPFGDRSHDYKLALDIMKGLRPKISSTTKM